MKHPIFLAVMAVSAAAVGTYVFIKRKPLSTITQS